MYCQPLEFPKNLNFVLFLCAFGLEILEAVLVGENQWRLSLELKEIHRRIKSNEDIWLLLKSPYEIERCLAEILSESALASSSSDTSIRTEGEHLLSALYKLDRITPGKRKSAELLDYAHFTQEGLLRLRTPLAKVRGIDEYTFRMPDVFIVGDLTKLREERRLIQADIFHENGESQVISVLSKPIEFAQLSQPKRSNRIKMQLFIRRNYSAIRIAIALVTSIAIALTLLVDLRSWPLIPAGLIALSATPLLNDLIEWLGKPESSLDA